MVIVVGNLFCILISHRKKLDNLTKTSEKGMQVTKQIDVKLTQNFLNLPQVDLGMGHGHRPRNVDEGFQGVPGLKIFIGPDFWKRRAMLATH